MSDAYNHRNQAKAVAQDERDIQAQVERSEQRSFAPKEEKAKPAMQAGARPYPAPLFPEQHQTKPGVEAKLDPQPMYDAPFYKGIRVNAVAPGPVWTPLNPADQPAAKVVQFGATTPMRRPAQPQEIAPAYVFLASLQTSSFITGEILPIIGGYSGG